MTEITVFRAHRIVTMNALQPVATHVAMRDGRILAVGDADSASSWGAARIDDSFVDKILLPGFVEGHAHLMAGGIWRYTYLGYHDRTGPDGTAWPGATEIDAVIARLKSAAALPAEATASLVAWGFDPIFLPTERLNRRHLDTVSATRPILVLHSNGHMVTVNSAALALVGYDRGSNVEGIGKFPDGEASGEVRGMAAMQPLLRRLGVDFRTLSRAETSLIPFAQACNRCGVTTATDLINELTVDEVTKMRAVIERAEFPIRLYSALSAHTAPPEEIVALALKLAPMSTEKLRVGAVKIIIDGSIQAFSAKLRWPGYYKAPEHSVWNMPPETLFKVVDVLNAAGVQIHLHTNGDLATEMALQAIERALDHHPRRDHRHTLQHCQLPDRAQYRRIKALGLCVNVFANHLYYFGDKHHDVTVGPDRAHRMNACGTALELGVPLAIHSDAPVTPMGPLFTAWCAVNRRTSSGRLLGAAERISVAQALQAITLGAAYTLFLDGEIGSIETGKRADFAVLEEDPLSVGGETLRDVPVWGTVLGGRAFKIP